VVIAAAAVLPAENGDSREKCLVLWLEAMTEYYRLLTRKHYFTHLTSVRTPKRASSV
jgi:hypothetical protein